MQRLQPTIIEYFELNQDTTDNDMFSRVHLYKKVRINPGAHANHVRLIPCAVTFVGLSADINPKLLQHLPKQVYAVNLHAGVNEEVIKNLPNHIIQVNFLEKISLQTIKNLPQQITTVAIHPGIDGEMTRALPKQVVRVIIQGIIDPSAIRELPQSVSEIGTLSPFSGKLLGELPRHVTKVTIADNWRTISWLPPHVTELSYDNGVALDHLLAALPKQITKFHLTHPWELSRAIIPNHVTDIVVYGDFGVNYSRYLQHPLRVHILLNDYNTLNTFAQKFPRNCTVIHEGNIIRAATAVTAPMNPATASTLKRANPEGEVEAQSTPSQASKIVRLPGNALQPLLKSLSMFTSLELNNSSTEANTVANEAKQTSVSPGRK